MNIIYLISIFFTILSFMLLKKNNKKNNVFLSFIITVVLFFSFNSFIIFLLSIFNISAPIWLRTILNIILSIVIIFFIFKNKKIQKYYIKIVDVVVIIILVLFGLFISKYRFGDGNLIFETTDPAVHFKLAEDFYSNSTLRMDFPKKVFYNSDVFDLFSSYTMLGTIFQLFGDSSSYIHAKVFIGFEVLVYILSGIVLYLTLMENNTEIKGKDRVIKGIFVLMLTIFYMFGYPFSNLIFGFHYLGLAVLLSNIIIYCLHSYYNHVDSNRLIILISLSLLNLYIFNLYYLFIPIIYGGEGLYVLYRWFILKKIKFKQLLLDVGVGLIIPFAIGMFLYFVYPSFVNTASTGMSTFRLEGYIYRNLIGNFLMMIPFVIYAIINSIKNKKINIVHFTIPFILLFMIFIFYKIYNGSYATYYYFKFYYLLIVLFVYIIGLEIIKNKFNIYYVLSLCLFVFVLAQYYGLEGKISDKQFLLNPNPSVVSINHVLQYNQEVIMIREPIYTKDQLSDINDLFVNNEELLKTGNVLSNLGLLKNLWIYSLYDISVSQDPYTLSSYYNEIDYNVLLNEKNDFEYLISTYDAFDKLDNKQKKSFNEIYKNNSFVLYKINK